MLEVRTVDAEYLIAMKLCAGRQYKNDMSDIIGILSEHKKQGVPITLKQIENAYTNLYGSWNDAPEISKNFIEETINNGDYDKVYAEILNNEKKSKDILIQFEKDYPGRANDDNIDEILKALEKKRERPSVSTELEGFKEQQQVIHTKPSHIKRKKVAPER